MKYVIAPNYLQYQRYVNDQVREHNANRHDYRFVANPTMLMSFIGEIIILNMTEVNWGRGLRETVQSRQTHPEVTVRYVDT